MHGQHALSGSGTSFTGVRAGLYTGQAQLLTFCFTSLTISARASAVGLGNGTSRALPS